MLNGNEICLNTPNYTISNMQDFQYWLCTSIMHCFHLLISSLNCVHMNYLYVNLCFISYWPDYFIWAVWRENRMVNRCVRKDSLSCDPSHITWDRRPRMMWLGSQREESVLMHLSTIRFSFYAIVLLIYVYK